MLRVDPRLAISVGGNHAFNQCHQDAEGQADNPIEQPRQAQGPVCLATRKPTIPTRRAGTSPVHS
jgi:hypothetical protein